MVDGTESSTVEESIPAFEAYLSSLEETPERRETPPAQKIPEPVQTEPVAAEQADAEQVESEQTEEQTEEVVETPATATLDPSLKLKLKVNGEEVEETLEEILKGYSRTADYTRKTQEIAASKKAFESEQTAVREERQKYASYLTQLEAAIQQNTPEEPDWATLQRTAEPAVFASTWAQWQQHKGEMAALKAQKDKANAAVNADQAAKLEKHLEGEQAKLLEAIPEWKTPETATADKAKLAAYAETIGFTQEQLVNLVDHRPLVLLRKAMLWDEAQAAKPAVKARIEAVRTATPGTTTAPRKPLTEAHKAKLRLAKTGREEDAAAAFEAMMPD